jgi:CubicO group peptidase (beta-lactamase class C family)
MLTRRRLIAGFVCAVLAYTAYAKTAPVLTDQEIRGILVERVEKYRQSVGIVVGVITPEGRRVIAYGKSAANDPRALDGETVFEIGSITKIFTSLLLSDMVEHHEVELDDPAAACLPPDVHIPERNGQEITLEDLATHTSGLPRMPSNVDPADPSNPYADYSVEQLYDFLSSYQLPRGVVPFEYSNLGAALLGHALTQCAGMDYETLVESRITGPLHMTSTHLAMTPDMRKHLAIGHAYGLEPTSNWDLGALAAAGALHSTVDDLMTLLAAQLGFIDTPLAPSLAGMMKVRRDADRGEVALAWFLEKVGGTTIISHDGSTGGYRSYIGYDPDSRVGVVVLSNSGAGAGVEDIGMHILNPVIPLRPGRDLEPAKPRTAIKVESRLLDTYEGRYRFPTGQMATVTHEGDKLFLKPEGDVKVAFYPETNEDFFAKIMDAQMTFVTDAKGKVTELLFRRNGSIQHVKHAD